MPTDLDWLLTPGLKGPAKSKAQKRKSEKDHRRAEALQAQARTEEAFHHLVDEMNMWTPVAKVQIIYEVKCSCGRSFLSPELTPQVLPSEPLIRFNHKRTGELWEKRCRRAESIPPDLPKVIRRLQATSSCCPECVEEEAPGAFPTSPQFDLFH